MEFKKLRLSDDDDSDKVSYSDDILDSVSVTYRQTYVNLDGDIETPESYRKVFSLLNKAHHNDAVVFRINSSGGSVDTALQLVNAIQNSSAYCVAEIYSAYSAAGVIVLACDKIIPMKFASMMIHNISWGSIGKVGEIKAHADFMQKSSEQLVSTIYGSFLTTAEIKAVLSGSDFWLTEEDIVKRLKKWKPMRKSVV